MALGSEERKKREETLKKFPAGKAKEDALRTGWLYKQGPRKAFGGGRWHKRFFVVSADAVVLYYKGENDKIAKGVIDLMLATKSYRTSEDVTNHAHSLGVDTPGRTFFIYADSEDEADSWVATFNEGIELAADKGTRTGERSTTIVSELESDDEL